MRTLVGKIGGIFWIALVTVVILALFVSVFVPLAKKIPVVGPAVGSAADTLENAAGLR